jgi:hypothetical protein
MRKIQAMTLIFGAAWAGVAGAANQAAVPGSYTDTLTVAVTY